MSFRTIIISLYKKLGLISRATQKGSARRWTIPLIGKCFRGIAPAERGETVKNCSIQSNLPKSTTFWEVKTGCNTQIAV